MTTRLRSAALVALVALLPMTASGLMVYMKPIDAMDRQTYTSEGGGGTSENWYDITWTMDTIGSDWTLGTNEDPMAENVEDLRDSTLNDIDTDQMLPALQEKQRGITYGVASIETTLDYTNAFFTLEPGNGWFPSLSRNAGDPTAKDSLARNAWSARTVDGVQEKAVLNWTSTQLGCPGGELDMISGATYDGPNSPVSVQWAVSGGSADRNNGFPDIFRNDRIAFGLVHTGDPCAYTLTLDFHLQFVHEADGPDPAAMENIGYYRSPANLTLCKRSPGYDAVGWPSCSPADQRKATVNVDVLYAPIFPVEYAFWVACTNGAGCFQSAVASRAAGTAANIDIIHDTTEFKVFAFDKSSTGFVTGQVFHLTDLDHQAASGTQYNIVLV